MMDSLHNIDQSELYQNIKNVIESDESKVTHNARVYVQLKDNGEYEVSIQKKNFSEEGYVKVPNRLVRDCLNKTNFKENLYSRVLKDWSKSLDTSFFGRLFHSKVDGKGKEDFEKNILKSDLKKFDLDINKKDTEKAVEQLSRFRESNNEGIENIKKGRCIYEEVIALLVNLYDSRDFESTNTNKLWEIVINPIFEKMELTNESYRLNNKGLSFLLKYYHVDAGKENEDVYGKDFSEKFINNDPTIKILLSLLGVSTPITFADSE